MVHLPPSSILSPVSGRFNLNYAGVASPRVSSTEAVRTSPARVSTIASIRTSPSTSPRVSLAAHPRASALTSSSFPLSGIDLLEQVSIPVVDSFKQGAFVPVNASNGPRVAQSWSNVGAVSMAPPERMQLEYIPPVILNDRVVVSPPEDVERLGQSKWQRCIVGHFLDKKLAFTAVSSIAMRIWAKFAICEVHSNEQGFFFFLFEGEKFQQILERGPWHFRGKMLILKLWHPHLKLEKEQLATIPLWVHFFNVPLELWTGPGLSYVAS